MKKYFDSLISSSGRPISGASITVYTSGTASLASLFSTSSGTALTNPVTSNSSGYFEFYAADGRYDLTISSTGYGSQSVTDILLEDPADANSAVINGGTINGTSIGATTPSTGAFTTLAASGAVTLDSAAPYLEMKVSGASVGLLAADTVLGGSANEVVLFGRPGKSIHIWPNNNTSDAATGSVKVSGTGLAVTGTLSASGLISPQQAPTASAPAYVKGAMYFDTTLNKLRIGGASAWETVTSV